MISMFPVGTVIEIISAGLPHDVIDGCRAKVFSKEEAQRLFEEEGTDINGLFDEFLSKDTLIVSMEEDVFDEDEGTLLSEADSLWAVYNPGVNNAKYKVLERDELTAREIREFVNEVFEAFSHTRNLIYTLMQNADARYSQARFGLIDSLRLHKQIADTFIEENCSSLRELMGSLDPEVKAQVDRMDEVISEFKKS